MSLWSSGLGLGQVQQRQNALAAQQAAYLQSVQHTALQNQTSSYNSITASSSLYFTGNNTITCSTTTGTTTAIGLYTNGDDDWGYVTRSGPIKVSDGQACKIELPDGTIIDVAADGSFKIEDRDAKVIYRASRLRDFNPFINVSDRLEEFIEFCGKQGIRQGEMLELPINLFIGWLVLQAAKADKEPEPSIPLLPDLRKRTAPRCPNCGRFTLSDMRAKRIEFCAPQCFERHYHQHVKALPQPLTAETG